MSLHIIFINIIDAQDCSCSAQAQQGKINFLNIFYIMLTNRYFLFFLHTIILTMFFAMILHSI